MSRGSRVFICLLCLSLALSFTPQKVFASPGDDQVWEIFDNVTPMLEKIKWQEEGNTGPPAWIEDGRWYYANSRIILVKSGHYLFASFSESFNWPAVNASFGKDGWHSYPSFEAFRKDLLNNPNWWLCYSWGLDASWLGVTVNTTKVEVELPGGPGTSEALLRISCHITNIPGFFVTERFVDMGVGRFKLPSPLFAGFDLTSIYIGDFEALQWIEDYGPGHRHFKIYFETPANLLTQYKDEYSLTLRINPPYTGKIHDFNRLINITMPFDTEVMSASPANMSSYSGNIVMFNINAGDRYPESFSMKSGPPIKSLSQSFIESFLIVVGDPSAWLAFVSLIAIGYTGVQGRRVWSRRKTYYRLYRSMVNLYNRYSNNFEKLFDEIETLSMSVTNYFVEGKISDDQFDKLLTRRDDLIERAYKLKKEK
jgi:hypothetical protein